MRPILLIMWTAFQSFILRHNNNNNNNNHNRNHNHNNHNHNHNHNGIYIALIHRCSKRYMVIVPDLLYTVTF